MNEGLLVKFSQNPELLKTLKEPGNAMLAECAVNDRICGIVFFMFDPDRMDRKKWNGQGLLGYAFIKVRD